MSDDQPSPPPPAVATAPPDLLIRAARESDAEVLNAISNLPGFRAGTLRLPYERVDATRAWLAGLKSGDTALVALRGGEVVGTASLIRLGGRRAHAAQLGMGVHDAFCGRGVGTALLGALVEAADAWLDIRRIELSVFADNARAIRLYERFGFEPEGVQRCAAFRAGHYADTLAMARLRM